MLKKLLGSPAAQFLIGRTIGLYMLFVGWTTRWRMSGREHGVAIWTGQEGVLLCMWHGRFPLSHKAWFDKGRDHPKAQPVKFLISRSREGDLIAHTAMTVGAQVIRGSAAKGKKDKGGFEASRDIKRWIDLGGCVGLTPDGPRGPRMRAKMGPITLAKLTRAPLLPIAWSTRWRITAKSWDRFILALPFGPGALVWGEPISVPRDADDALMESLRLKLEAELNRISAEADRLAGAPIIEPAAPEIEAPESAAPETAPAPASS